MHTVDILKHFLTNLHLRSHLDLILFSLITLIYVLPAGIAQTAMSIHILILSRLQKSLEDWLLKQTSLSFLPRRPLVLAMVALMLTLLTLASPLVSLLLLILCLLLFLQMSLRGSDKLW